LPVFCAFSAKKLVADADIKVLLKQSLRATVSFWSNHANLIAIFPWLFDRPHRNSVVVVHRYSHQLPELNS
jgi:hypothetical protein